MDGVPGLRGLCLLLCFNHVDLNAVEGVCMMRFFARPLGAALSVVFIDRSSLLWRVRR